MYRVTKEKLIIENEEQVVYGISYNNECCMHDVSSDKSVVERLVEIFNEYKVSPVHLGDLIEDFFGEI